MYTEVYEVTKEESEFADANDGNESEFVERTLSDFRWRHPGAEVLTVTSVGFCPATGDLDPRRRPKRQAVIVTYRYD
jgi:hypothetical protein